MSHNVNTFFFFNFGNFFQLKELLSEKKVTALLIIRVSRELESSRSWECGLEQVGV